MAAVRSAGEPFAHRRPESTFERVKTTSTLGQWLREENVALAVRHGMRVQPHHLAQVGVGDQVEAHPNVDLELDEHAVLDEVILRGEHRAGLGVLERRDRPGMDVERRAFERLGDTPRVDDRRARRVASSLEVLDEASCGVIAESTLGPQRIDFVDRRHEKLETRMIG